MQTKAFIKFSQASLEPSSLLSALNNNLSLGRNLLFPNPRKCLSCECFWAHGRAGGCLTSQWIEYRKECSWLDGFRPVGYKVQTFPSIMRSINDIIFLRKLNYKHEKSSPLVTETQRMYKKYVSCWGQRAHYKLRPFGRQLLEKNGPMEYWAMIMAHCAEISQTFATESWVLHEIQSF